MDLAPSLLRLPPDLSNRDYCLLWYLGLQRHVLGDPGLRDLHPLFQGDPARMTDLAYVRRLHYAAMCRIAYALDGGLLRRMVGAIDGYVRGALGVPAVPAAAGAEPYVAALDRAGHTPLPPIDAGRVRDMRRWFEGQPVRPGLYDAEGPLCALAEVGDANIANHPAAVALACPHLAEIAADPLVLDVVARHLGAPPTIVGYTAWWSFAGRAEARDAQLFHLDNADYAFCKLFVQLTDVDMDGGPHAFVPRTHDPDHVGALRAAWPGGAQAFNDWYFLTLRKTDADTRRYLGEPDYITGPAGSLFLANTRGIHKGLLPTRHDRLVCQVVYGVTPYMQGPLLAEGGFPVSLSAPDAPAIPRRLAAPPGDYLQRLFLAP